MPNGQPPIAASRRAEDSPALLTKAMIRHYYVPMGERTLDRWISSGKFPRPDIAIGGKVRYWKRETVETWIQAQVEVGAP